MAYADNQDSIASAMHKALSGALNAHDPSNVRSVVEVSAPTRDAALALWDEILAGRITPDDDYEAPQVLPAPEFYVKNRLADSQEPCQGFWHCSFIEQEMAKIQAQIESQH